MPKLLTDGHEIPRFEGREVHATNAAMSGSGIDTNLLFEEGEEAVLITRVKCSSVAHKVDSYGVRRRVQSLSASHIMLADDLAAQRIAEDIKRQADEASGQQTLDDAVDDDDLTDDEWEASAKAEGADDDG